jgi:hypothetical protein
MCPLYLILCVQVEQCSITFDETSWEDRLQMSEELDFGEC